MLTLLPEAEKIMLERFGKDSLIAVATTVDNLPHVRTVDAFYQDGAFFVLTHALSGKMQQIEINPVVAVAGEWFTAHGKAVNMGFFGKEENAAIAKKMREIFFEWIDNGHSDLTDPNTVILRIDLTDGVLLSQGRRFEL